MRTTPEVRNLRAELKRLTGRVPVSYEERYLRRRLADIQKRAADGEDVTHRAESAVCSFSTTESGKEAIQAIVDSEKKKDDGAGSMSKLAVRAIAYWAKKHGYTEQADIIGGE